MQIKKSKSLIKTSLFIALKIDIIILILMFVFYLLDRFLPSIKVTEILGTILLAPGFILTSLLFGNLHQWPEWCSIFFILLLSLLFFFIFSFAVIYVVLVVKHSLGKKIIEKSGGK